MKNANLLSLKGMFLIDLFSHIDKRGKFQKLYNQIFIDELGLDINIRESFISESNKGDIRGMHYQNIPFENYKIVSCISGEIIDVVLDLRLESPSYGISQSIELSCDSNKSVIIPPGIAHGFQVLSNTAVVHYLSTREYSSENDMGILWNSFGFEWPLSIGNISERDLHHPKFDINKKYYN